jgi:hypothetical protein
MSASVEWSAPASAPAAPRGQRILPPHVFALRDALQLEARIQGLGWARRPVALEALRWIAGDQTVNRFRVETRLGAKDGWTHHLMLEVDGGDFEQLIAVFDAACSSPSFLED